MMRGVILAAGRGSRMGNLGDDRPKCLIELEGKPLIERQIAAAAPWLRAGPVIVSYSDIFYRSELVCGLIVAPGQLVISYDRD